MFVAINFYHIHTKLYLDKIKQLIQACELREKKKPTHILHAKKRAQVNKKQQNFDQPK